MKSANFGNLILRFLYARRLDVCATRPVPPVRFHVCTLLTVSKIQDVSVGAKAHIVGQVPAFMVRIFEDDKGIALPDPITAEIVVVRSHAEVEAVEPEALPVAAGQPKDVATPEPAQKLSMLPGMIEMVARIVRARIVADPLIVAMHVRSVGMARLVGESAACGQCGFLCAARRLGILLNLRGLN